MIEPSGYVVRIERTFDAPAEKVFDAWTSPEVMRRWFHCEPDWETPEAEVDLRPGGRYRLAMQPTAGDPFVVGGTYREVVFPEVGHSPHVERPQEFAVALLEHLDVPADQPA